MDNPLQNAAQNMGLNKPNWFIGQNKNPQVVIPQDQPDQGGKWFCSMLLRHGLIDQHDFKIMVRGHAIAAFTHGDFIYWYTKNAKRLAEFAEMKRFDWSGIKDIAVDRSRECYENKGIFSAIENYMRFCEVMDGSFGGRVDIDRFDRGFYHSSAFERIWGTVKLFTLPLFWKQMASFVKNNFKSRKLLEA